MASLPGGTSDKLGNEFERLWTIRQLIHVLAGRAISVTIEALGDDERGTEFWVSKPNGTREAHQCKRENGSLAKWTISDLNCKKILSNAKYQLDRSPDHRYVFVSADKASSMADLCERARAGHPAHVFCTEAVNTSHDLQAEFQYLCRDLEIDINNSSHQMRIQDFLRRFDVRLVDKSSLRSEVEDFVGAYLSGDPSEAVTHLEGFISRNENFGRILGEAEILLALPAGARPRDLTKDATLPTKIRELRDRFYRSYRHLLIEGKVLERIETKTAMALVTAGEGPRLILIHGAGATGKTGVAYELVSKLEAASIITLPLRLDRDKPADSAAAFGEALDLPASPTACLNAAADGRIAVLLLDQLDAIRWTATHSSHSWDTCERLIEEALRHRNLRVIVVCRTFDVEDDPKIKSWKTSNRSRITEVRIAGLDDETLIRVLNGAGSSFTLLSADQKQILRSPQSLYLWLAIFKNARQPPSFRTTVDLMERFWEHIRGTLPVDQNRLQALLDSITEDMDARGLPFSHRSVVAAWTHEVDALISANVLTVNQRQLLFSHQSYLDYLTAERVNRRIRQGSTSLVDWLRNSEQSLFRRGQLRQVLTLLREQDHRRFVLSLGELITSSGIRFHLRHLALQVLANIDVPTLNEIDFVEGLLERDEWHNHILQYVVYGREQWFDAIHRRGLLRRWLVEGDQERQNQTVRIIESFISTRTDAVGSLILERNKSRHQRVKYVLWSAKPALLSEKLFRAYRALFRREDCKLFVSDWPEFCQSNPQRAILLFKDQMSRVLRITQAGIGHLNDVKQQDRQRLDDKQAEWLCEAAKRTPDFTWQHLAPVLLRTSRIAAQFRRCQRMHYMTSLYGIGKMAGAHQRALIRVLTVAGRTFAKTAPQRLQQAAVDPALANTRTFRRVVARSVARLPKRYADYAIQWLITDAKRFSCGGRNQATDYGVTAYAPATRILRRFGGHIPNELFEVLEAAILRFVPHEEIQNFKIIHKWFDANGWLRPRALFMAQFILLSGLPPGRLAPRALGWFGVLSRKFGNPQSLVKRRALGTAGFVGTTIPRDRITLISDRTWMQMVTRDWASHANRTRQMGPGRVARMEDQTVSGDLGQAARACPDRIARLAMQLPTNTKPIYIESILRAFGDDAPPPKTGAPWQPVSIELVEAITKRFAAMLRDTDIAKALCWIIRKRPKERWGKLTIDWLNTTARTHPDPLPEGPQNATARDAVLLSINCVRGVATEAISDLLYTRIMDTEHFRAAIECLVVDPHVAVRIAAIGLAVPLLNGDRKLALKTFVQACNHADERVLESRHVDHFLSYTLLSMPDDLRPTVERMLQCPNAEISRRGGSWAAEAWTHKGLWNDLYQMSKSGSVSQKCGAIGSLTQAVLDDRSSDLLISDFLKFFNDPLKEVRDSAAAIFRYEKVFKLASASRIIEAFVESDAFIDNADDLLYGITSATVALGPFAQSLRTIAAKIVTTNRETKEPMRQFRDSGLLATVLLRLYEQSESDPACRSTCLDAWDQLLKEVGPGVLEKIDA